MYGISNGRVSGHRIGCCCNVKNKQEDIILRKWKAEIYEYRAG